MTDPTITCPSCHTEIKLNKSLAAPLIEATRKKYEQKLEQKEADVARREAAMRVQHANLVKAKEEIDDRVAARLKIERESIVNEEQKKARLLAANDLDQKAREVTDLKQVLEDRNAKLADAQKAQAELIRKQRELDDARREMDLTIEKRVQESLAGVRDKAKQDAEEGLKLKVLEKEEQITSMQRQIEELRRRAEQGSQQLQGEAQEADLKSMLRVKFPRDIIQPVPKGEFGGDVLQRVIGPLDQPCGTILWETKRTKSWSDGWLPKLRDDQRAAKADLALLVSQVVPKSVVAFDLIDGVWIAEYRCAIPVGIVLRQSLIELSAVRQAGEGQQTKMAMVYQYLTGPRFRHRIEAIVEKFSDMQEDLDRERKTMTRLWAKREAQLRGVIKSTAGMYGDLQGIAGKTLQEIDGLGMQLLDAPKNDAEGAEDQ